MARIAGVDLPRDKRVDIALRYIYGIGPTRSAKIVTGTGLDGSTRVRDLSVRLGLRVDKVGDAFGRCQVQLAVEEGAAGEFAGLGQP